MNIAVPSMGKLSASSVSSSLGRSPFIVIYDDKTKKYSSLSKSGFNVQDGSGIRTANLIIRNNIDVLLTMEIGRKAYSVLMKEHVDIHLLSSGGNVKSVINKFLKKEGV